MSASGDPARLPPYASVMASSGVEGDVELAVAWLNDSTLDWSRSRVVTSSHDVFGRAVLDAVRAWQPVVAGRSRGARGDSIRVVFRFRILREPCRPSSDGVDAPRDQTAALLRWRGAKLEASPTLACMAASRWTVLH